MDMTMSSIRPNRVEVVTPEFDYKDFPFIVKHFPTVGKSSSLKNSFPRSPDHPKRLVPQICVHHKRKRVQFFS